MNFQSHVSRSGGLRLSLADVITRLEQSPDLKRQRRYEITSAIRVACKALGLPTAAVAADPDELLPRLEALPLAVTGVSRPRWIAAMSLVRRALREVGLTVPTSRQSLTSAWESLSNELTRASRPWCLSRFMRFCSSNAIAPEAVDDAVMDHFAQSLVGVCRPKAAHKDACKAWNWTTQNIQGWPARALSVPDNRHLVALPASTFTSELLAELDRYLAALQGADRLAIKDPLRRGRRPLRATTIMFRRTQLMQLLSVLVRRGHPAEGITLSYLVDNAEAALRFFVDRLDEDEESGQVHQLAIALKQLGTRIGATPEKLEELSVFCSNLNLRDHGMTEKNRARLRQFDDPENLLALLRLPLAVADEIRRGEPTVGDAVAMKLAVAVELLIMRPWRIRTIALIDIDRHISRTHRSGVIHIAAPAANVKTTTPQAVRLPAVSAALLNDYLSTYRPLLRPLDAALFPDEEGKQQQPGALGRQIERFIKARTGLLVNPHLFRAIAAMIILNRNPDAIEDVRQVLGNKSVRVIMRHYVNQRTKDAIRRYDELITKVRGQPDEPEADE